MFPFGQFTRSYFASGYWPGGEGVAVATPDSAAGRDWDVWDDVATRINDTGQFDAVEVGHPNDWQHLFSADLPTVALVTPVGWDEVDESSGELNEHRGIFLVTIGVQDVDPRDRYLQLDRLASDVQNALDGQSLAELTYPPLTKLRKARYEKPTGAEQRVTIQGEFTYQVTGHAGHDESER